MKRPDIKDYWSKDLDRYETAAFVDDLKKYANHQEQKNAKLKELCKAIYSPIRPRLTAEQQKLLNELLSKD